MRNSEFWPIKTYVGGGYASVPARRWYQVGYTHYRTLGAALLHPLRLLREAWTRHYIEQMIALGGCQRCGSFYGLIDTPSMTCYTWDGKGEDPNRSTLYCEDCSADYVDYMTERWEDYYQGRL